MDAIRTTLKEAVEMIEFLRPKASRVTILTAILGRAAEGTIEVRATRFIESASPIDDGPIAGIFPGETLNWNIDKDFWLTEHPAKLSLNDLYQQSFASVSVERRFEELPYRLRKGARAELSIGQRFLLSQKAEGISFDADAVAEIIATPDWTGWNRALTKATPRGRPATWDWPAAMAKFAVKLARYPEALVLGRRDVMALLHEAFFEISPEEPDDRTLQNFASLVMAEIDSEPITYTPPDC